MKIKREVATYTVIGALVAVAILLIYSSSFQFTGLVVFGENSTTFNEGGMVNLSLDGTGLIVLSSGNVTGTYTSGVFGNGSEIQWNNLTWTGDVPENASLSFQITECSDFSCSDANFNVGEENNVINLTTLTKPYFQYRVLFSINNISVSSPSFISANISHDYSVPEPEFLITIYSPLNSTYDETEIGLNVSSGGIVDTWLYNLNSGNNETFIPNITITAIKGTNTLIVYANDTGGNVTSKSVSFSVILPLPCDQDITSCDETNCGTYEGNGYWYGGICNEDKEKKKIVPEDKEKINLLPTIPALVTRLTVTEISNLIINPNQTKQITLSFRNDGETTLASCTFGIAGDSSSWVTHENGEKSLNPGQEEAFVFDVSIPENTEEGSHLLTAIVSCSSDKSNFTEFVVDVIEKKLEFEIIDVQRTRDDRVRVLYSLEELAGEDQDVGFVFSLVNANDVGVGRVEVNQSIDANSIDEFRTNININESLLQINETTNEILESELTLNVNFNSQIYSSSVQEKITIGAPVGGFAIFGGVGAGSAAILLVVVLALAAIFFIVRKMRKGVKTLGKSP